MINRHEFSTVEAVEEIVVLTKAAAVEAAATPKKYEQETGGVTSEDELKNRDFANLVAFFAQLAEVKFETFFEDVSWSLPQLTYLFKVNDPVTEQDVRVACMWLIHAPMKIWSDIELRLRDDELELQYEPEFWPRWKQCLQDHQQTLSDKGPVNETRDLVKCALDGMDKVEATLRE
ncbi:unnamed protein product [Clonostachys solani]|uniref:Uncharacterized protein n=1 Tax=Clonostachys solani TaxID=160281 RepID=A0A9P0E850_9HYPO|nr:unnamed protein product [Clonostachys solani]